MSVLGVLKRQVRDVRGLASLLPDSRSKLLAYRVYLLERRVRKLDRLINPPVESPSRPLQEDEVATLQKNYYTLNRNEIAENLSGVIEDFILLMNVMFQASPIVELELELSKNLSSLHKAFLAQVDKCNESLADLVSVARYPDEILKATGEFHKSWNDLKMAVTHNTITPLKSSLVEEARRQALNTIQRGVLIHGSY